MALPIYESRNVAYAEAPSLTATDLQENIKSNLRLNKFLNFASEVSGKYASEFAQEQAVKTMIANPITKDRIDASMASGQDPLAGYLTGGLDYNAALKKAAGQQTSGILQNQFITHYSNVLERADKGEITNNDELLNELEAPITAQINLMSQIDSDLAFSHGNTVTNLATNAYQKGLGIFKAKSEEEAKINAYKAMEYNTNTLYDYLENNPTATKQQIQDYINATIANADKTALGFSKDRNVLKEKLTDQMETVRNEFLTNQIAKEFQGKSVVEVVEALKKNKSIYSEHYKAISALDKPAFENLIEGKLRDYASMNAERKREVVESIANAQKAHDQLKPMSVNDYAFIAANKDLDPALSKAFDSLRQNEKYINQVKSRTFDGNKSRRNELNNMIAKGSADDPNFIKNINERDFLDRYINTTENALNKDSTQKILVDNGVYQSLDFTRMDQLPSQLKDRISSLRIHGPKYNKPLPDLLTDEETTQMITTLNALPASGKIAFMSTVANSVGQEYAYKLFKQIAPKDVKIGHMGQLLLRDPDPQTMQFLTNGMTIVQSQKIYVKKPDALFAEEFKAAYNKHPDMVKAIQESAKAIYAGMLQKEGKPLEEYTPENETFDEDLYKQALRMASGEVKRSDGTYGGVVSYNGGRITLPRTIKQDDFDLKMQRMNRDDVIKAMVTEVTPGVKIPAYSYMNGKYYRNEYDPNAPSLYKMTKEVIEKPLLEFDYGGQRPQEFSIARLREAQLEMIDENTASFMIDGQYFDTALDGGEKLMIDITKLYNILPNVVSGNGTNIFDLGIQQQVLDIKGF